MFKNSGENLGARAIQDATVEESIRLERADMSPESLTCIDLSRWLSLMLLAGARRAMPAGGIDRPPASRPTRKPSSSAQPVWSAVPRRIFSEILDENTFGATLTYVGIVREGHHAGGGLTMSCGVLEVDEGRVQPDGSDPGEFARGVRRFALDAREILGRPESTLGELIGLHGRVFHLLQGVPGTRTTGILPWLLAVRQQIGARLQSWSVEDLESRVA